MKFSGGTRWGCVFVVVVSALFWVGWQFLPSWGTFEEEAAGSAWFVDVTEEKGLHFVHDPGPLGSYFMPQIIGSGAALFDMDGDGRLAVYLTHNGGPDGKKNQLFCQRDGRFQDVSAGSGLDFAGYCMGVAVADVNNDGLPDVLVTEYQNVRLFLNCGGGTFIDVSKAAGLKNPSWGTSAAFVDYDRDGWLDLVVVNYVEYPTPRVCNTHAGPDYCPPAPFRGQVTRLFHNLGRVQSSADGASLPVPLVQFTDVTDASGLGAVGGPGLGVVCADFNADGWPDIFVANDGKPNHLWINQHNGSFKEEAASRGVACNVIGQAEAGMGAAVGDVNGDGLLDLFVSHLSEETHTLWTQGPRGLFRDETAALGVAKSRWRGTGFGVVLVDFDLDGALDLALVNGRVGRDRAVANQALGPFWGKYAERNQLFANEGDGRFRDISAQNKPFCAEANVARGLAWGDIDGDGTVHLLVTTVAGSARLYRAAAPRRGRWLMVRAVDPALHRDAIGAEVRVQASGKSVLRLINPAGSYLCSSDVRAHFGLGATDRVESIEVVWPDGMKEVFPGCRADHAITVEKGKGKPSQRTFGRHRELKP